MGLLIKYSKRKEFYLELNRMKILNRVQVTR